MVPFCKAFLRTVAWILCVLMLFPSLRPVAFAETTSQPSNESETETPTAPEDNTGTSTPTTPEDNAGTSTPTAPEDNTGTSTPTAPEDNTGTSTPTAPEDNTGTSTPTTPEDNTGTSTPTTPEDNTGTSTPTPPESTTQKGFIHATEVQVRTGPGTNHSRLSHGGKIILLHSGHELILLGESVPGEDGNATPWYPVSFSFEGSNYQGYIRSDFITVQTEAEDPLPELPEIPTVPEEPEIPFEEQLAAFPASYQTSLRILHELHPNWRFEVFQTGLDWGVVQYNENKLGRNLTDSRYPSHYSTAAGSYDWYTDTFYPLEAGRWYQASPELLAYYIDPRNFLNENDIFMFELLAFAPVYQTEEAIESMLEGTFMEGKTILAPDGNQISYARAFLISAYLAGVSPFHLVIRCIQEVGWNGTHASAGTYPGYEGYYNFFSIGANTGMQSGLAYAKSKGWNTQYKAILAGGEFISGNYLEYGQNTPYFQKFSVVDPNYYFWHQYMTNVAAPLSEGALQRAEYVELGYLDSAITFRIPVYNNMPAEPCAAPVPAGSPNNLLKDLSVNGYSLTPTFDFYEGVTEFTLIIEDSVSSIYVNATAASSAAKLTGSIGNVSLNSGENLLTVTCTSASGAAKVYTIRVIMKGSVPPPTENPDNPDNPDNPNSPDNPENPGTSTEQPAVIVGTEIQVRQGPATTYPRLQHDSKVILLHDGHALTVIASHAGEDGGLSWYQIRFVFEGVNYEGYVRSDFVKLTTDEPEPPTGPEKPTEGTAKIVLSSDSSVIVGQSAIARVTVTADSPLGEWKILLSFPTDLLEYVSGADLCENGVITLSGTSSDPAITGKSFEILFKGKEEGTARLLLTQSQVVHLEAKKPMEITVEKESAELRVDPIPSGWNPVYRVENDRIAGIALGTSVSDFLANLGLYGLAEAKLLDADGNPVADGTIRTGLTLSYFDGKSTAKYHLVLYGDINGDGLVDAIDLLVVRRHLLGLSQLEENACTASDVNKDGAVDAIDLLLVRRYLLGLSDIAQ